MSESASADPLLGIASQVSFDRFSETLLEISRNHPDESELQSWLVDNVDPIDTAAEAENYITALETLRLIEFRGTGYSLTQPLGHQCYSRDAAFLLDHVLEEEIGEVSDILLLLVEDELTIDGIADRLEIALDDGDLHSEVVGRVQWLEQLSFVERDGETVELTDAGEEAIGGLETQSLRYSFDEDMSVEAVRDRLPDVECYWVNNEEQSELTGGFLEAPDDGREDHDLTQVDRGEVIFHYYDGTIRGYSSPSAPVTRSVSSGGEPQFRLNVAYRSFDNPIPLRDVISELLRETYLDHENYSLDTDGVRDRYLASLPTEAAEYLFENGAGDSTLTYGEYFDGTEVFDGSIELEDEITELFYPNIDRIVSEVENALAQDEHIILVGPPGTGKSQLATTFAEAFRDKQFKLVTATADWSTFDTIGGYQVDRNTQLKFTAGVFLHRFQDQEGDPSNEWLIIDELNRADIDKAFGSLFSALAGGRVTTTFEDDDGNEIEIVGHEEGEEDLVQPWRYYVPHDWRLLGTMNTYDKTSLYDMSYAFMRRFAFVFVDAPTAEEVSRYFDRYFELDSWDIDLEDEEREVLEAFWREIQPHRTLGPAIIEKMARHLEQSGESTEDALTSAITMFVIPQFEGLPEPRQIEAIRTLLEEPEVPLADRRFKRFCSDYFDIRESEFEE